MICRNTVLALAVQLILMPALSLAQQGPDCRRLHLLDKTIRRYHISPIELNDKVSSLLFDDFVTALDPDGIYFTRQDTATFSRWRYSLDDAIRSTDCSFLDDYARLYRQKLLHAGQIMEAQLAVPFAFTDKEFLQVSRTPVFADHGAYETHIRRWLKFEVLTYIFGKGDSSVHALAVGSDSFRSKEAEARAKVLVREKRNIARHLHFVTDFSEHVFSIFLKTYSAIFDPHTSFYTAAEKEKFEDDLAREAMLFGFTLHENPHGEVAIGRLMPGGPAWRSNELHKGDVLQGIRLPGKETIDLSYATLEETGEILAQASSQRVILSVRKRSGQVVEVQLSKERMRNNENVIESFLIEGRKRIGYIALPDFYSNWNDVNPLGCANDVAREIVKLRRENTEGLIIDLRNNGGGSLYEAISLVGIFVDQGPLFILQERGAAPLVVPDRNRGVAYDGPLVILINTMSASASELVAGSLQHLNRAVIVGCRSYGKASGQAIFPLETDDRRQLPDLGFVKVTEMLLYRLDGISYQQKGIDPDVPLPDLLALAPIRETDSKYALTGGSVSKDVMYRRLPELPHGELRERSLRRTGGSSAFAAVNKTAAGIAMLMQKEQVIPLEIHAYKKQIAVHYDALLSPQNVARVESDGLQVRAPQLNQVVLEADKVSAELSEYRMSEIRSDLHIAESYHILLDLIELSTKQ